MSVFDGDRVLCVLMMQRHRSMVVPKNGRRLMMQIVDCLLLDSFTNSTVIPLIKYKTGDLTDINNCRANYFV